MQAKEILQDIKLIKALCNRYCDDFIANPDSDDCEIFSIDIRPWNGDYRIDVAVESGIEEFAKLVYGDTENIGSSDPDDYGLHTLTLTVGNILFWERRYA